MNRSFVRSSVVTSLLCAATLLGLAASALAQGMYYKEIRKDDRIYVFNNAANADRFEKSGEMGVGITKPGVGPNGETVIGDNERALQLYFFKHGISEAVPDPVAPVQTMVWRDGKTRITTDNAYLEISNRVQVRFTEELPDDNTQLAGTGAKGDMRGSFRIRRAKLKLEGWMIKPWLTYEVQMNWPAVSGANVGAILEDAAFDIDLSKGKGTFRAHIGQFKPPFGAQELTSSGNQMFVDRALVSNNFFRGRETGVALWGALPSNKIEWRVGMFNGNGPTRTTNDNDKFQYNARIMWQPNGSQVLNQRAWVTGALYSESDFESTTAPIYSIALNWENQNNFNATTGNDQKWNTYSVDGIYKFKGFSVNGMYSLANRRPETGVKFDAAGGFIQAGKLFSRRRYEIAARYGQFDPTDIVDRNITKEARGAFNYYYARHGLKWQSDVGQVQVQPGPTGNVAKTWEVRSQLQFIF
ncbi:MAG: porin [Vicinamibacterales bacterium]